MPQLYNLLIEVLPPMIQEKWESCVFELFDRARGQNIADRWMVAHLYFLFFGSLSIS